MSRIEGVVYCDGCGVEISWSPYKQQTPGARIPDATSAAAQKTASVARSATNAEFCCKDCAEGRPCQCAERMEIDVDEMRLGPPTQF